MGLDVGAEHQEAAQAVKFTARLRQAQGMVAVQACCRVDHALVLMTDRATITGLTLDEIATAVHDRMIRFG